MATKKLPLPEYNATQGTIVDLAKQAVETRAKIASSQAIEGELKTQITKEAFDIWDTLAIKDEFIGIIRVTSEESPIRIEFRNNNGSLSVDDGPVLDELFKATRPLLFEREQVVSQITNPAGLIDSLERDNKNPWDYVELRIKPGMDVAVTTACKGYVTTAEAYLPKPGLLATIKEVINTLSTEAKDFLRTYLKGALAPTVVIGTKGKA